MSKGKRVTYTHTESESESESESEREQERASEREREREREKERCAFTTYLNTDFEIGGQMKKPRERRQSSECGGRKRQRGPRPFNLYGERRWRSVRRLLDG